MLLTPSELRAEIARLNVQRYKLAALVGIHPGKLGQILKGTKPMPDELAERIARAIRQRGQELGDPNERDEGGGR